jgi:hypothetical protein
MICDLWLRLKNKNNNTEFINDAITNLLNHEIDNLGLIINPKNKNRDF